MENQNTIPEFDLDDILNEFHDQPQEEVSGEVADPALQEELNHLLEDLPQVPAVTIPEAEEDPSEEGAQVPMDTGRMNDIIARLTEERTEKAVTEDATIRLDTLPGEPRVEAAVTEDATVRIEPVLEEVTLEDLEREVVASLSGGTPKKPDPIPFNPRRELRELKKKLVAGPEKRYYALSELGVGRLQLAMLANFIILAASAAVAGFYTFGMFPENRLKLVIFTQVLAMLLSALIGCHAMLDGMGAMFRGKFNINSLIFFAFAANCADAVFCLTELRIPCCAAFSLEISLALWARYQQRSTEMSQMDTLRKAVRLHGLQKVPGYPGNRPGILRFDARPEDFMDEYGRASGPQRVQSVYTFLALVLSIAISVYAGMTRGISMALQILSVSLLVAVPAGYFVALTRPAAILERRLHMVGTVLCGWKGVKKLCGKAAFPLKDEDIFPLGSTKLNGVKFYGDLEPDEVIARTASLMEEAGGGLVPVFRQLLASRNGELLGVKNFQNYGTSGFGGEVKEESVLVGTLNFLQDMGVEMPEGTMVNQAVYAAIDGQLSAVFALSYAKMRSAAAGLVTLCAHKSLTPTMVGSDYMINEGLLRSKFGVNTKRIAFPDPQIRAELAQIRPDPEAPALAICTREDLVSAAYAVTGARALKTACSLGTAVGLTGGILGLMIMAVLAFLGAQQLLTPTNVLLYQLVWLVPGLLVTEWTRTV